MQATHREEDSTKQTGVSRACGHLPFDSADANLQLYSSSKVYGDEMKCKLKIIKTSFIVTLKHNSNRYDDHSEFKTGL